MTITADQIKGFCELEWPAWQGDCSGFVKAVAKDLGIQLTGQADSIIDSLESSVLWQHLGTDSQKAIQYASQNYFVIGGLKAVPHGHVVIVVQSAPQPYPVAYWGSLGHKGYKNKTINWSWSHADLSKVRFYAIKR